MDLVTLSKSKKYIDSSIAGIDGVLAGKNCKIQSVEDITNGHRITFSWSDDEGVARTTTVDVMDGNSIEEVEVKYASSQSGTTPPPSESGWSDDVPSVPDGYYLWTRNTITFSNGDTKIEYLVGRQGVDGVSPVITVTEIPGGHRVTITDETSTKNFNVMDGLAIDHIEVDYAGSSSGTTPPPSESWSSTVPVVATGNYLWTRNTTYLKDNTTSVAYMVALQGATGISPDVETTQLPNGTLVNITDKDGPHPFTIYNGEDGTDGRDGADGADGFSPIITTDKVGKTTTITIVDATGTKYATILDGADGKTITNITINSQNHVIVTYSDGTTSDAGELIVQSAVMSVNGQTGDVELALSDVVNVGANLSYDSQTNTLSADAQSIDVDSEISSTSENPVQNKVIKSALDDKVDKISGKGLSTNDYTTAEKDKLSGIASGAEVNVQSDWNQTDTTADDYIKNKPDIPAMQLQSDWNQTDTTAKDYIKNKPTLGTAAAKDSTNSVTENSTDLVESGAVKTAIDSAISRVYKPAGNKTCAQLTSELLVKANLGNVYNMTDSGTTTSDFVEGAGKTIELGDNVAVVDVGTSSSPSYKFDLLSGMVDLTNYIQKSNTVGLLKNDGTVDTTEYNGKITVSNDTSALTDSDSFDETSAGANPTSTKRRLLTSLWTYIKGKITGAISGIVDSNLTASRALVSDSNGKVAVSDVTSTELGYLDGVTSNIQTQIDNKADLVKLPTDTILHYSFDEIPDIPDGTSDFRYIGNTYQGYIDNKITKNGYDTQQSWTEDNGNLKVEVIGRATIDIAGLILNVAQPNEIIILEIEVKELRVNGFIRIMNGSGDGSTQILKIEDVGTYRVAFVNNATSDYPKPYIRYSAYLTATFIVKNVYAGDGSYSTPVIDNANGQYNSISQSGIAVKGVSGKGFTLYNKTIDTGISDFNFNNDFTFSIWVNPADYTNGQIEYILRKYPLFWLRIDYIPIRFFLAQEGYLGDVVISNSLISANQYNHLVFSKQNKTISVYVNGTRVYNYERSTAEVSTNTTNNLVIGSEENTRSQSVDDLLIFDRALSEQEVLALYQNKANTPKYYTLSDYENKQLSQSKADKVLNATNGHLASLDSNGNLTDSGKSASDFLPSDTPIPAAQVNSDWNSASGVSQILNKPALGTASSKDSTSSVTSGSTDLVESGAVADEIQNITDIASSLPTDSVLHYSFDEVPDLPNGTADIRLLNNNTYDLQSTNYQLINYSGTTFSNVNGNVQVAIPALETNDTNGAYIRNTYISNKVVKLRIRVTAIVGKMTINSGSKGIVKEITDIGVYDYSELHTATASDTYPSLYFFCNSANNSCTFTVEQIYIGDGSYSTPIIDNANGQNNATNNGGLAVQGVSGKGAYFLNGKYAQSQYQFDINKDFAISFWVKPDNNTTAQAGYLIRKNNQFHLLNGEITWATNALYLVMWDTNANKISDYLENTLLPVKWSMITLTRNGNKLMYYRDGIKVKEITINVTLRNNDNATNVCYSNNTRPQSVDDLLIFDRALSETEVQALYQNKANTPKYFTMSDYKMPSKQNTELSTPITIAGQSYTTVESALSALAAQLT